jgi:hypothetical protein
MEQSLVGKGLVQLGHVAADARPFLDQVDLESRGRQVKRGLNAADAAAHDHHVAKIARRPAWVPVLVCNSSFSTAISFLGS